MVWPENIILAENSSPVANTLAYLFVTVYLAKEKMFCNIETYLQFYKKFIIDNGAK
jgi:hypothetical protein